MQVSEFDFFLPPELIAQYPQEKRSASRLLVLNKQSGALEHRQFSDLTSFLQENDLLIFNNTRVIPARLFGKKQSGGKVEILVERILENRLALSHVKSNKSCKLPMEVALEEGCKAIVYEKKENLFLVRFEIPGSLLSFLKKVGHIPLPPYIERQDSQLDVERYQTIYADRPGAIAAPTAGLHFDEDVFEKLRNKNIQFGFVTLHVGAGTFQPVKTETILEHKMHSEWMELNSETINLIRQTKEKGGRVIAVGTTAVRCLETAAQRGLTAYAGETAIFIYPGFQFNVVDGLITNFHLPRSTLLMLVSAFAGKEMIFRAYQQAIDHRYRFFSYGDALLAI